MQAGTAAKQSSPLPGPAAAASNPSGVVGSKHRQVAAATVQVSGEPPPPLRVAAAAAAAAALGFSWDRQGNGE